MITATAAEDCQTQVYGTYRPQSKTVVHRSNEASGSDEGQPQLGARL